MGKVHIKKITQMYGSKKAQEKRSKVKSLQESIDNLQSSPDLIHETVEVLKKQRDALSEIYKHEARGALIRARFQYSNEIDTCSTYFFNLESSVFASKSISNIRLPCGNITDNPREIKHHVRSFYKDLYSRVNTDKDAQTTILDGLPHLNPSD